MSIEIKIHHEIDDDGIFTIKVEGKYPSSKGETMVDYEEKFDSRDLWVIIKKCEQLVNKVVNRLIA